MKDRIKTLVAKRVVYYSEQDEDYFFAWLDSLPPVKKYYGIVDELFIECDADLMSDDNLRELLALFCRYGVDTAQLDVFETDENRHWFMDKDKYWRQPRV